MIISFVFLLIMNLFIIFYIDGLSKLINIYDTPDNKLKLHKKKTPILGGFILVINFSIIFILQVLFFKSFLAFITDFLHNFELITDLSLT